MKKYFIIGLGSMLALILLSQVSAAEIRKVTVICEYSYQGLQGAHVWADQKIKTSGGGLLGPEGNLMKEFWEPPVGLGVVANAYTDNNGKVILKLLKGETYKINVFKMIKSENNEPILIGTAKIMEKLDKDELIKFVWNKPVKMKNPGVGQPQLIKNPLVPK